ncbi:MAG TPA: putative baseplate assembly protein [Actinomycetes bacterium]|nr:putative baseplate assembly protein [Actinomycetes bacterium]
MSLPAPNLDDRRFQDLVDDAKRLVQRRCPEWTDHNVSDPGVTLIETFATMVDQLLYRLNRVPDRLYVRFLELLGVRLFPPSAARADVTFWLSAPQPEPVRVPVGTEVATVRTESEEAVGFSVVEDLAIVPCSVQRLATSSAGAPAREQSLQEGFYCFDRPPRPDDALLVGLSEPVPGCVVALRFDCEVEGVGVDPTDPPIAWEAWDGGGWAACEVDQDTTGGLNRAGDVLLHVPRGHVVSVVAGQRAGWLRCRAVPPAPGQPAYSAPPWIVKVEAHTIGGTATAVHAEIVHDEVLGTSEHVPGERFVLRRRPVVPAERPVTLEVVTEDGVQEWTRVDSFAERGPGDPCFTLDEAAGEVVLGPAVREPDGSLRQFGAVPPKDALLRVPAYRTGGGERGNVARHAIRVLKSSIPYVNRVDNRRPAAGGVEAEDVDSAKLRGPLVLRTRDRAVVPEDYEHLAAQVAPEVARVRCAAAGEGADAGAVRVLVVPAVSGTGRLAFEQLQPDAGTLERIAGHLDERRTIGARVVVEPPFYQGVTVVADLRARPRADRRALRTTALDALYRYFHPVSGGPDGDGWPFGRPVHVGEAYAVFQGLRDVELVEEVRLFAADPITGARGEPAERLELGPHALAFSYEHQVRVAG